MKADQRSYEVGERESSSATDSGLVDVDGVRLAFTRSGRGAGPSVLLAHGLTDPAACWDPLAKALAPSYDVVRYDARGHGASDRATDYSFESHTNDVIGLARALRLDRPILIGHSMGGAHAAVAAPKLNARAVIVEDPPWPEVPDDGTKDVAASRRSVIEVAALPQAQRWARGRAEHPTWTDVDLRAWVQAQGYVDPDSVNWFDSWPTTNRWGDHVKELHCPGLLLIGDHTRVTTRAAAEGQRTLAPASGGPGPGCRAQHPTGPVQAVLAGRQRLLGSALRHETVPESLAVSHRLPGATATRSLTLAAAQGLSLNRRTAGAPTSVPLMNNHQSAQARRTDVG